MVEFFLENTSMCMPPRNKNMQYILNCTVIVIQWLTRPKKHFKNEQRSKDAAAKKKT